VESGEIELAEFDFWYAKRHLARPGYLAMEEMKAEIGDSDPELAELIENPVHRNAAMPVDVDAFWDRVVYRPEPFEVPVGLKPLIARGIPPVGDHIPVLIRADLDRDGTDEYALLMVARQGLSVSKFFYRNESDDGPQWRIGHLNQRVDSGERPARDRLLSGEISLMEPQYRSLSVGGVELRPMP